ncbi:MAG: hypothetical protein J5517_00665 [Eubacterium sp.]|nr:hypothetical protein [Eubacterium sp.]
MNFIALILIIIVLGVGPLLIGQSMCGMLKLNRDMCSCFVVGNFSIWALCQVISVPIILFKESFLWVVIFLSAAIIIIISLGIMRESWIEFNLLIKKRDALIIIVSIVIFLAFLLFSVFLQHTDADDSRFVVNAVDIIRTHRMFLTNPATGEYLGTWKGEVTRDVTSPWAVFISYCSYICLIHPTIVFHLILPINLYFNLLCIYWILSDKIVKDGVILYRCIFIFLMFFISIYGYASVYTAETFLITRIWQGKSVVVGLGIPFLISLYIDIYNNSVDRYKFILLLIVETALCLASGMGITIGALMAGSYGIVYAINKKEWRMGICMCLTAVPNVIYMVISLII